MEADFSMPMFQQLGDVGVFVVVNARVNLFFAGFKMSSPGHYSLTRSIFHNSGTFPPCPLA